MTLTMSAIQATSQNNLAACRHVLSRHSIAKRLKRMPMRPACQWQTVAHPQENDARILRGLTGNLEANLRAARAAALESALGPKAAKAAAEAAYSAYAIAHGSSAPAARPESRTADSSKASGGFRRC